MLVSSLNPHCGKYNVVLYNTPIDSVTSQYHVHKRTQKAETLAGHQRYFTYCPLAIVCRRDHVEGLVIVLRM